MSTTWLVDDLRIDLLVEDEGPFNERRRDLPALTDVQALAASHGLAPRAVDADAERLVLSFHSYVVRTPTTCVLVDTCVGDDKSLQFRPAWHRKTGGSWIHQLASVGLVPEDIDIVVNTHLHLDHVGWNTCWRDGAWAPTFPRARYVIVESEYAAARQRAADSSSKHAVLHASSLRESVEPVIAAGLAELVDPHHVIDRYTRLIPTPGHTAGHVSVAIGDGRDSAVFTGDLFHSPLQVQYPEAAWAGDELPSIGIASRRAFLDSYSDTETLVCSAHFPAPSAGRLHRHDGGWLFQTAEVGLVSGGES